MRLFGRLLLVLGASAPWVRADFLPLTTQPAQEDLNSTTTVVVSSTTAASSVNVSSQTAVAQDSTTLPCNDFQPVCKPLDILMLQDVTTSVDQDLLQVGKFGVGSLATILGKQFPNSRIGLMSFRDKPLWPLGMPEVDYCQKLELDLTQNFSAVEARYGELQSFGGGDPWENQFGALFVAGVTNKISWASDSIKLIILITDAPPHYAKDGRSNVTANLSPHTELLAEQDWDALCVKEDYPPAYFLKDLLKNHLKSYVAFLVDDTSEDQLAMRSYQWFNEYLEQPREMVASVGALAEFVEVRLTSILDKIAELKHCGSGCPLTTPSPVLPTPKPPAENTTENVFECMVKAGVKHIHYPGTVGYLQEIIPYDLYYPTRYPLAVISPADTQTVASVLKCATPLGHNVIPRSGSHDYSSYSYGANGDLILDLRHLSNLTIDQAAGTARVGPGMRGSTFLFRIFQDGGWALPMGACTSVGLGGHIKGGGYGYYTRSLGLGSDHVTGAEFVLANGSIVNATLNGEHHDLVWAIQGGGGAELGVITSFTFKLIKAPPVVASASYIYLKSQLKDVLYALLDFAPEIPRNLSLSLTYDAYRTNIQSAFLGTQAEMEKAIKPFNDKTGFSVKLYREGDFLTSVGELSIMDMLDTEDPVGLPPVLGSVQANATTVKDPDPVTAFSPFKVPTLDALNTPPNYQPTKTFFKPKSLIWTNEVPLTKACADTLVNITRHVPLSFGIAVELLGGHDSAIAQMEQNATGFSLRNIQFISHLYAKSYLPLLKPDTDFVDEVFNAMKNCASNRTYINYKDHELGEDHKVYKGGLDRFNYTLEGNAKEALLRYHAPYHFEKLVELKKLYNPQNQFWYPQAFRLSY